MVADFFRLFYRKVSEHNKNIIYIMIGRDAPTYYLLVSIYAKYLAIY